MMVTAAENQQPPPVASGAIRFISVSVRSRRIVSGEKRGREGLQSVSANVFTNLFPDNLRPPGS